LTGFLLTLPVFLRMPEYNVLQAIGISLFHSISAFNNAGFDIIGDSSLLAFSDNIYFNLVTCGLIIFGGIGFLVWDDIFFTRNPRKFSTQTKIVLITYFTILAVSFLSIWGLSQVDGQEMTWLEALSYSVNLRTAGFSTIDTTKLGSGNLLLSQALMFIGGNPLSTAGGIKTTTIFVILATLVSFIRSKKTIVFRRRITQDTKIKAFLLFGFGVVAIIVGSAVIGVLNPAFTMEQITYEATSAFGTVGFSQGITPNLHWGSKLVLCFLMYTGRVSPVSYLSLFNNTFLNVPNDNIDYLDTDIMIG
jgi:trk system potassium uptake protein TrkH